MSFLLTEASEFSFFKTQHITIILIMIVLCVGLPLLARRRFGAQMKLWVSRGTAIFISAGAVSAVWFRLSTGSFDWRQDLPLDLCNLFALVLPILFWRNPSKWIVEVLYYLILGGTLQGVLTPDIPEPFPNLLFFSYWITHCGLIIHIIYVVIVWQIYPRKVGVIYSFFWLNAFALGLFIFNYFADANYLYLMEKPPAGSLLDFLGPWPWYILNAEPVALVVFWLAWLPFARFSPAK